MLKGAICPMITIFDENGKIDYKGNEMMINNLINNKINGILFAGSMGEFFNMTLHEKKEIIDLAVRSVNKRVPVLIGTGGTVMEEVIELTKYAQKSGVDGVVVISPYYFKLDEESIYRYYAEIAKCVDIPIILYNFPDRTSVNLSPHLVLRLARDFKNIVGIKDTVDNMSHTRRLIETVKSEVNYFMVFSGFDEYFIPNLMAGGDGVIGGLTNVAPALFAKLLEAFRENDMETVSLLQKKVNKLMNIYDISQPFVSAIKAAVSMVLKDISSTPRKPAIKINDEQAKKIKDILLSAGVLL
ncbi:4-hydroxy-tetrahydrodipicolinate synthase [Caldanaerobius polysaccharolyticus]|uniref:4-hydroxy-tetrahydrodipicolinate synthase n=1 Tax=Caldanaerobius polysaccharolyticus TaxID=44256 RepID=UPI0004793324|nr:4-hydroxy-tetrahydrodipicolinate synthase [Caldanaerobius polysaccharolyticus]